MQTFTSINANLHMRIFAYLFGWRQAGAAAARGKQAGREARRATAPAGAEIGQHGGCVPAGAWQHGESPPAMAGLRVEGLECRPCGAADPAKRSGVGRQRSGGGGESPAARWPACAGGLSPCCPCWHTASVLPAPAGLAEGRSCPACLPACLRGRGLGTRRRRPGLPPSAFLFRVSGGLFLPFLLHGPQRVWSDPFRTFSDCFLYCKSYRLYFISRK